MQTQFFESGNRKATNREKEAQDSGRARAMKAGIQSHGQRSPAPVHCSFCRRRRRYKKTELPEIKNGWLVS
jgi:hypothetical protein